MRTVSIGLIVLTLVVVSAAVSARPPEASRKLANSSDGPEVGRVRMRDRIVPSPTSTPNTATLRTLARQRRENANVRLHNALRTARMCSVRKGSGHG
jgi:hypothetical protein